MQISILREGKENSISERAKLGHHLPSTAAKLASRRPGKVPVAAGPGTYKRGARPCQIETAKLVLCYFNWIIVRTHLQNHRPLLNAPWVMLKETFGSKTWTRIQRKLFFSLFFSLKVEIIQTQCGAEWNNEN